MAKCACTAPPLSAHPHQNKTQTKLQPTLLHPHQWAQRAENDRRGPAQKCTETPALSPPLCRRMERSRSSCCWLHGTFETVPFTQNKVWSCECAGCRAAGAKKGGQEEGESCIQNDRHTLPDQRGADSPFILQISRRGRGAEGGF